MLDAVLSPGELPMIWKVTTPLPHREGLGVGLLEPYLVPRNLLQPDAAYRAHLRPEVSLQQALAQSDALEYLRPAIRADGRDTHLRHDLEQSLLHGLDIVGLRRGIVLLYLMPLHQVVENGKCHVGTECRSTIAQQQRGMHGLADFSTLHNQGRLHALAHRNQIVMDGRDGEQRWDIPTPNPSRGEGS